MDVPAHDPETLESNVPGLYLAGALLGGRELGKIFIENTRHHAGRIAEAMARRLSSLPAAAGGSTAGPSRP
jgi:thioredoxin reductase (NADPH)